ncbi:MAG: hypothetical protein EXR50_02145 [Dehalococcoidia bacterium]|nr:hypothetical protein [Dehalococcoidia bacterium]
MPTYRFVRKWGSQGGGDGQFNNPAHIAVDRARNVLYVADVNNHRIQKFTTGGTFLTKWGGLSDGPNSNGLFAYPRGVAVDGGGNVYVADTNSHRIQKFTSEGTFITKWGANPGGSGNGEFNTPTGVAVDSSDNVYVADAGNKRIQKFTSSGTYLGQWGSQGTGDGRFDNSDRQQWQCLCWRYSSP